MHTNRKMVCRYGNPIESWANGSEEGECAAPSICMICEENGTHPVQSDAGI
ncbi:hypothetical protein HPY31_12290 [Brevibacillus sp. HB1.3]|uniref:hypothetical protein n=1 Tax=Brevibacillus sp. HB1.3 TaxID=2738842 RepID=UPI001553E69E|nr:hypothetical protein [Brevibacillus sp. HB1.3]NQF14691.1 hypothetical protein [Brevibacillus sp. HB1.3]